MPAPHRHVETITAREHAYVLRVGGTLDAVNTLPYGRQAVPGFQPNLELTLENTGNTVIENPRLTVNGEGSWRDRESLIALITRPGMTDEEKAFAVWNFIRHHLQEGHTYPDILERDDGGVLRFLNACGTGACGTFHGVMPHLAAWVGLKGYAGYVSFGAHATQKTAWGGRDHYLDGMLNTHGLGEPQPRGHFPLALDNNTIAGVQEILADPYLLDRAGAGEGHFRNVAYFGRDCNFWPIEERPEHDMDHRLRPGEAITFRYAPVEHPWAGEDLHERGVNANGNITYRPEALPVDGVVEMRCPWPIVRVEVETEGATEFSFDGSAWDSLPLRPLPPTPSPVKGGRGENDGKSVGTVTLRGLLHDHPALRAPQYTTRLWLRFSHSASPPVITLTFQTFVPSLLALVCGDNNIHYTADSAGEVRVTHTWRESSEIAPPGVAPDPLEGEESRGLFRWQSPEDEEPPAAWEFYLSPREDLLHPLAACFHLVLEYPEPRYGLRHFGYFNNGHRYWWRVRARSRDGMWGAWSETWSFVAAAPEPVAQVRVEHDADGREWLAWDHPGGARFEIFGDTEPGFTPRLADGIGYCHDTGDRGPVPRPANLVAETPEHRFDITECPAAFYRVVPVDGSAIRGTPSACVAAPHPKVVIRELPPAIAGQPYRAAPVLRRNAGRWIVNIRPDLPSGVVRYGADRLAFRLVAAPAWMRVDGETGELSGTPGPGHAGRQDLFLEVEEGNGRCLCTQIFIEVLTG